MSSINRPTIRRIQQSLLGWFDEHRRELPWRVKRNPYWTWVSEIMLQQTQVSTVVPYFERLIRSYPSIASLAKARESEVLKLWEGLGYYSRARNLVRGARQVMQAHAGTLPPNVEELRRIPGIGRYTAGAIASIAFDRPEPVLDGNVMRLLCRLRDLEGDPRKAPLHERLWSLARRLASDTDAARLNESLMELGALVCTPHNPQCQMCPLRKHCRAYKFGRVEQRPQIARNPSIRKKVHIVLARRNVSQVLVHKRDRHARPWANLWTFPYFESGAPDENFELIRTWLVETLRCRPTTLVVVSEGKYSITRYNIAYTVIEATVSTSSRSRLPTSYAWIDATRLKEIVMPAPHRRLALAHFGVEP